MAKIQKKISPFPAIIEIQLHNQCNANCTICPYERMGYIHDKMKEENFLAFVGEIKSHEHEMTRIIPYLNNEPFMDKNYLKKLSILRQNCPNVEIEISTNGSYLNEKKIIELAGLQINDLRISVFGFTAETYKKMMPGSNYQKVFTNLKLISKYFSQNATKVSLIMIDNGAIDETEFLGMEQLASHYGFGFFRWGFLDRSKNVQTFSNNFFADCVIGCEQKRPEERMHVLSNGDAIFCCQDWAHKTKIGNIFATSIEEVWHLKKYNKLRELLYDPHKQAPSICRNCKLAITCQKEA